MRVLILGSGPIVIGQAAEFDYAGTQACRALREEGVETILVNSNPATIMTDRGIADVTYLEPLTTTVVDRILERERPDGLLATLGGQTALNLAVELADRGILERHGVRILGTPLEAIRRAEDRAAFKQLLLSISEPAPESAIARDTDEALAFATRVGYPLVVRPAFTLGGTGGGLARDETALRSQTAAGIAASPIGQVLIERSLVGWKEIEYEVVRDSADTCIAVCNMENLDPMGVHTGDSIVVAPSQTLTDPEYQHLRSAAFRIIRALGIEGACNIQFAVDPACRPDGADLAPRYFVIEVNPRVSRSSALASKATGYPIARVAAKVAVGKRLDEIVNLVTAKTTAAFEPALDYVVVKIPRWPFDKFPSADRALGTQMKATGEVMAIDRSFEAALQKAVRSLELKRPSPFSGEDGAPPANLSDATDERLWALAAAFRGGASVAEVSRVTGIDAWFLRRIEHLVRFAEDELRGATLGAALLRRAKSLGFSDRDLASLAAGTATEVREARRRLDIRPTYKMVDTCAGEFEAATPYFYSTYAEENEAPPLPGAKCVVLGAGPIRIGQGIEFDCCAVQAARALEVQGVRSIMINSNPETVSTDFDASARLYFEPLDEESVAEVLANEMGTGDAVPVLAQFGGQTALERSQDENIGASIIGTTRRAIAIAEDRRLFHELCDRLAIPQPPGGVARELDSAIAIAETVGYPVVVRPSFVLGGRGMDVARDGADLARLFDDAAAAGTGDVLIDRYIEGLEVEVDAVSDGADTLVAGIMEHVERAGVHSGDSFAVYPPRSLLAADELAILTYTARIASALPVKGLLNIQFIVRDGRVFVLEANPRASRTVPFLSKVTGVPLVEIAVGVALGKSLRAQGYSPGLWPTTELIAVKAPVFSTGKLAGVDARVGMEMKSTGEAIGVSRAFESALCKALSAAGMMPRPEGAIVLALPAGEEHGAIDVIEGFHWLGYDLVAGASTAEYIRSLGIPVREVGPAQTREDARWAFGLEPDAASTSLSTLVESGRCALVIDATSPRDDAQGGYALRRSAVARGVPCFTSLDTARALLTGLRGFRAADEPAPIEEYRDGTDTRRVA